MPEWPAPSSARCPNSRIPGTRSWSRAGIGRAGWTGCSPVSRVFLGPAPGTLTDDRALDAWIADHLGTAQHTCGTVSMGPAVDQYGRVHRIAGLRVADTSILPDAPVRGPAATAVLIGELVADAMRRALT